MRNMNRAISLAVAGLLLATVIWAQAPPPAWKDGEYPLYDAAMKATDNAKKIDALKAWEQKIPDSNYKSTRLALFLVTYKALNQFDKVLETGNEILAMDAKNILALWEMTAAIQRLDKATPEQLTLGEKAAQTLATKFDELKPAATSEADWAKGKPEIQAAAYVALGWIATQRKDNAGAEKVYLQSLQINPNNAQVSYTIGSAIILQRNADTYPSGLFHIARAASLTGTGSIPEPNRKKIDDYLIARYTNFHGSAEGLDELRKLATASAIPPEGYKIKSSAEIANEKEEEFKKTNPMLALWMSVKKELAGPSGADYFEKSVKGFALPAGVQGVTKFKGKLVAAVPPKNPKSLKVAIADAVTPEITLVFEEPLVGSAPVGTDLEFEGAGTTFTADPFNLTMEVEREKLVGWPVQAGPAKKAGGAGAAKPVAPAKPVSTTTPAPKPAATTTPAAPKK
jgi:tetratricopeptide (TPR) repeat protein